MFERVLLCYDGSPASRNALERGAQLAAAHGSRVFVLALGGDSALVALWAPELDTGEMAVSHAMPRVLVEDYRERLWKIDEWRLALVRNDDKMLLSYDVP